MSIVADGPETTPGAACPARVVVTGSTGFIGGHVVTALRRRGAHVTPLDRTAFGDDRRRTAALSAATAVVHCVSAVAGTTEAIRAANVEAASVLADGARSAGIDTLVVVSTAAVTGPGPHRGSVRADARPSSPVSRARAEGERILLDAGATVVRPNLVWGAGDQWVVPTLARIMRGSGGVPPDWRARVSVVGVRDLAAGLAALATCSRRGRTGGSVLHADAPGAVPITTLTGWIERHLLDALPARGPVPVTTAHQRSMLEVDNWFDGSSFWASADVRPPAPFRPMWSDVRWYRSHLRASAAGVDPLGPPRWGSGVGG